MIILAMIFGFLLDALLGDPYNIPHPVRMMGKAITRAEATLRKKFPPTAQGERKAGLLLAIALPVASFLAYFIILWLSGLIHPILRLAVESWMCYQLLAARSLRDESMKVYAALRSHNISGARSALSMIVGRDTAALNADGIARAAAETVAENLSDGVIAPLCFMALGGAPLMALYKAVNTLDSMVGYKNQRYQHFGCASAKLDDILNFIPARLAGLLIILSAALSKMNAKGALRIFLRDRKNHSSPNSAQTEAACAGALGIRLAEDAYYGGQLVRKPYIGDPLRPIEPADILRSNRLMYISSALALALLCLLRGLIVGGFLA